jgi:hypothetical protein
MMDLLSSCERPGLRLNIHGDDEEDSSDNEDSETEEVIADDIDFEDFAASFAPPPLPHFTAPTVILTAPSPLTNKPPSNLSTVARRVHAPKSTRSQLNSSLSPWRSCSTSHWCVFWEVPKVDIQRDLDFVLERDLDAGW